MPAHTPLPLAEGGCPDLGDPAKIASQFRAARFRMANARDVSPAFNSASSSKHDSQDCNQYYTISRCQTLCPTTVLLPLYCRQGVVDISYQRCFKFQGLPQPVPTELLLALRPQLCHPQFHDPEILRAPPAAFLSGSPPPSAPGLLHHHLLQAEAHAQSFIWRLPRALHNYFVKPQCIKSIWQYTWVCNALMQTSPSGP